MLSRRDGDEPAQPFPIVSARPCKVGGEVSQEFAWQFYVGLAAVATEHCGSTWLSPAPEAAKRVALPVARLTDLPSDLARWDDDGGAPRS